MLPHPTKDAMYEPIFEDYGRYGTIITEGSAGSRENRYSGLVSFVGQTGKCPRIIKRQIFVPFLSSHFSDHLPQVRVKVH